MTQKQKNIIVILVFTNIVVCCVLSICLLGVFPRQQVDHQQQNVSAETIPATLQPTKSPSNITRAVSPMPSPQPSPTQGLRYEDLMAGYSRQTTDLQQDRYIQQFYGTRVHWKMYVHNVTTDSKTKAKVYVGQDPPGIQDILFLFVRDIVILNDVPVDEASSLPSGQQVEFDAVIKSSSKFGGLYLDLQWLAFTK